MSKPLVTLMFITAGLAGCSSNVDTLAEQGNWYQIGYQDGVKGNIARSYNSLLALGDADPGRYSEGYAVGVDEYCDPNHAYQIGMSGFTYEGVCSGTKDGQKFRMEWQRGWNDFTTQN
ncbi:hypothetical protein BCU68_06380 [Vibrio sp. 10N.286.49.B3]|uniref:DUF2799 domain-containing protein n=1 Tax=Vibrio sp. 10N.286.49.B3 TaxID=1880855 RepID=UPI000C83D6AB|nr:DUF2799 domain-containing protein [Vibrio sp. 10N.286.49.B3]PMH39727.1 hypothetical protein BCU68_06380 [Vibrio sp. 10N.286.49.B3]